MDYYPEVTADPREIQLVRSKFQIKPELYWFSSVREWLEMLLSVCGFVWHKRFRYIRRML